MADISITPTDVITASVPKAVKAGEAITAGQLIYISSTDGKAYKADANATGKHTVAGITTSGGSADQWITYVGSGDVTLTANCLTAAGKPLFLSATAGAISDALPGSGDTVSFVGVSTSATIMRLNLYNSGIAKP